MNNILRQFGSYRPLIIKFVRVKHILHFFLILFLLNINSCVTQFIPEINETDELLVVEGLFTDKDEQVTIKLSTSMPLGQKSEAKPFTGCIVTITDDIGNSYSLYEKIAGTYVALSHGIIGRTYTLHIETNRARANHSYESFPMLMKAVPNIDSIYYEKLLIKERIDYIEGIEECQIYLDTHDPDNNCRFYRWDYLETWKVRYPFDIPNQTCWISNNSKNIYIDNTTTLSEDRITKRPVTYISNETDRLMRKYSILVNQYSLTEDEYGYWQKLQKLTEQVGGLYDVIPSSIPSNIICKKHPSEMVLGYFSVSAVSSKRIFIKDNFEGINNWYTRCPSDTLYNGPSYIEGLGSTIWLLFDILPAPFSPNPRVRILTERKECTDCTLRGTAIKPDFWVDD